MKNLLKNWLKAGLVVAGMSGFGNAADLSLHLGDWEFKAPFITNADAIGAYDVVNKKGLVGVETAFADYNKFEGTLSVLTDSDVFDGDLAGTLAIGARRQIPKFGVHIGLFLGRDFREGIWRGGIKGTAKLFGGSKE